jgi:hydrophobe/amphiphile efflux-1 (HAE1) family protein
MRFSHFFIDRPIFAGVVSVLIVLVGLFFYPLLPVAQYPEIAPPTIAVTASYPGASAETLADTVAAPLEQEINGVEDMIYMTSSSTGDGSVTVNVVFKLGTDLNNAQVQVQNRVASATPRLPESVRQLGITTNKNTPDILLVVFLTSKNGRYDQQYLSNYATLQIKDRIARLDGVGGINVFGARDYSMRIWIDPDRAAARNLTADEIVAALRAQNVQVAGGSVGAPPNAIGGSGFQLSVQALGRLTTPEQFGDIVIKTDDKGRLTRVSDVARVEIGAQDYGINAYDNGVQGIGMGVTQRPGSNALATAAAIIKTMEEAKSHFPPGLEYDIPYNPTDYVRLSINSVQETLFEAVLLVVLVVLVFLQSWRAAIIPVLAIPVSLIGTFAVLAAFGFSLNNLSLFGLVLAIGIVVDDAIVVVENCERELRAGYSPRDAAYRTMDEVGGALIAIALTLCAVFVPTAFISGISGQFYKQFALTISAATLISCLVSLTLSPALAAMLLRPHDPDHVATGWQRPLQLASDAFNHGFDRLSERYGKITARTVRATAVMLVVYGGLLLVAFWRFDATPGGFIPAQDQGYFIGVAQLPPGSSLPRTDEVLRKAVKIAQATKGVRLVVSIAGLDGASFSHAPNAGTMFIQMLSFDDRKKQGLKADDILADLRKRFAAIDDANLLVIPPPPVRGIGTGGGFKMMIQDRGGKGLPALQAAAFEMMGAANQTKGLTSVFTLFNTGTPRIFADIDREKAQQLGVDPAAIFSTLQTYLGSTYVNDFNLFGRTYRVTAQADAPYRNESVNIVNLKTRSSSGAMVPLGSVATLRDDSGPYRVVRHNLYPAAELQGDRLPGFSSGEAIAAMEKLAVEHLPDGFSYEWTELAYQEKAVGNTAGIVFALAVVFVFLLLAAQYESLTLPFAVILIVPMCLLAAILGVNLRGFDNNILTQIGLVVLVGLAAKNAILIVEFARQAEDEGLERHAAAQKAARTRLRPILMTSFAFILGVVPLVIASGPGAEMRQALGTAVFFGMIGVTIFGLLFTPLFFVIASWASARMRPKPVPEREPDPGPVRGPAE